MDQFIGFGIVGLSTAAIYAIIGSGLVLRYTTTGVFHFAHGAAGMISAYAYWQLTVGWNIPVGASYRDDIADLRPPSRSRVCASAG